MEFGETEGPFSPNEAEIRLHEVQKEEFGAGYGQKWLRKAAHRSGDTMQQYLFCAHHNTGKCQFRYVKIVTDDDQVFLRRGYWRHSGHDKDTLAAFRQHITPTKESMSPDDMVAYIGGKRVAMGGMACDTTETSQIKGLMNRMKRSKGTHGLDPDTSAASWAAVEQRIRHCKTRVLMFFFSCGPSLIP